MVNSERFIYPGFFQTAMNLVSKLLKIGLTAGIGLSLYTVMQNPDPRFRFNIGDRAIPLVPYLSYSPWMEEQWAIIEDRAVRNYEPVNGASDYCVVEKRTIGFDGKDWYYLDCGPGGIGNDDNIKDGWLSGDSLGSTGN